VQRKKAFRLKSEAEDFAGSLRQDLRTGSYVPPDAGKVLIVDWAARWLDAQGHVKPSTLARTRGVVATHILPRWGRVALSAVTFADVQGWVSKLVRDGAAPRSVAKVCGVFRQILGWAVQDG